MNVSHHWDLRNAVRVGDLVLNALGSTGVTRRRVEMAYPPRF